VRGHPVAAIGRDDAKCDSIDIGNMIQVGLIHRSRMKSGDLVIVKVGDDVGLRGKCPGDGAHGVGRDAEGGQALDVGAAVVAHRRHHHRVAAQAFQVIGDVAGAAAPLAAHFGDLKRHRQHVRLLRQDMARETIGKHRDGVDRQRTADQRAWRHEA
jgi:hypothetical protein